MAQPGSKAPASNRQTGLVIVGVSVALVLAAAILWVAGTPTIVPLIIAFWGVTGAATGISWMLRREDER